MKMVLGYSNSNTIILGGVYYGRCSSPKKISEISSITSSGDRTNSRKDPPQFVGRATESRTYRGTGDEDDRSGGPSRSRRASAEVARRSRHPGGELLEREAAGHSSSGSIDTQTSIREKSWNKTKPAPRSRSIRRCDAYQQQEIDPNLGWGINGGDPRSLLLSFFFLKITGAFITAS